LTKSEDLPNTFRSTAKTKSEDLPNTFRSTAFSHFEKARVHIQSIAHSKPSPARRIDKIFSRQCPKLFSELLQCQRRVYACLWNYEVPTAASVTNVPHPQCSLASSGQKLPCEKRQLDLPHARKCTLSTRNKARPLHGVPSQLSQKSLSCFDRPDRDGGVAGLSGQCSVTCASNTPQTSQYGRPPFCIRQPTMSI
jgi:hypothetical protein